MNFKNYKSFPIEFNKNQWGAANLITNVNEFNAIAKKGFSLGKLQLTEGGHLHKPNIIKNGAVWIIPKTTAMYMSSIELLILNNGKMYRFIYRPSLPNDAVNFTGLDALKILKEECADILKPFALSNNEDVQRVKNTIPKAYIKLTEWGRAYLNEEVRNVVHIDINSAFPAGVVARHPEFKDFFTKHFELRHTDPIHKAVMNYAIGACQSLKIRGYRYPQLAKDGIEWTNAKLENLTRKIKLAGYQVLGYNTDGLFYLRRDGQPLYSDKDEGTGLGQWKTDGVYDVIRFKSAGAYEYIKNGKYYPVIRGRTKLDTIKPRTEWQWGDIYKESQLMGLTLRNNQLVEEEIKDPTEEFYEENTKMEA